MEYATKRNGRYESVEFNSEAVQTEGKGQITLYGRLNEEEFVRLKYISKENQITDLRMPSAVNFKLVSRWPFGYKIPDVDPDYMDKRKIENYLYEITYGNIDYDYAYSHFVPATAGACTAIRNGKWFGRNFDWTYNEQVQFVVHTPLSLEHYGVLGVSSAVPGVVQSNVDNESITIEGVDMFKLVPFYLVDGVNDKGLFCTHNIVPLDDEETPTTEIPAKKEERSRVCAMMLVRFILDKFANVESALSYLRDYTTVFFPEDMIEQGYQSHFMIGDSYSTRIIEFVNGEIKIVDSYKYMTNFNLTGVTFNPDKTIIYPPTTSGIDKYGMGLERWNLVTEMYNKCKTREGMTETLDAARYSNAYGEPFWHSEIVKNYTDDGGTNPITVDTPPEECSDAVEEVRGAWSERKRSEGKVWHTCHSCVYDLSKRIMYIKNQEGENEYTFAQP